MAFRLSDVSLIGGPVARAIESLRQYVDKDKARGVVASAPPPAVAIVVTPTSPPWQAISPQLDVLMEAGRCYKVTFTARAFAGNANTPCVLRVAVFVSGTATTPAFGDHYFATPVAYGSVNYTQVIDGDGLEHSWTVGGLCGSLGTNTNISVYPTEFYIEDVGPAR